ncbi:MAG: endonuclease [Acidobacteria bacterium]|nr:MAG: endonuclease [Acidobacteriota bacterium]
MDGSVRIGIHTSVAGSYLHALESAQKLGCNALQIFSASPRMWQGVSARIPDVDAQAFRARRDELRLGPLVIHANYLINLASTERMLQTRSIQAFHDEIVRAVALGADFLVVHPGARGESRTEQAISTIVESVKQASKRAPMDGLRILIVLAGLRNLPVGACLDTAHLFAAGYDIKSEGGLASTIGQIDGAIGLENVPVIHVNDSKIPLGGRVDRHEHIGKGKIGAEAFARILRHPRFGSVAPEGLTGRAFVAETPIDDPGDDRRNVAALWELAGLKEQAPQAEKGFSMLTAALQKKLSIHRKAEKKRNATAETPRSARGGRWMPRSAEKKTRTKKDGARKSSAKKKRG